MRWAALFADLDAQALALERAERSAEVDERTRGEIGALSVVDRLRAAIGSPIRVRLAGGLLLVGHLGRVGPDWLLLDESVGREAVVGLAAVTGLRGVTRFSAVPGSAGAVESRLGLRHALRGVARDRSPVRVELTDASAIDATIDRVGSDFIEVARHAPGEWRRRTDVTEVEVVPLVAVAAVRRMA
jgi:hypothetical protein